MSANFGFAESRFELEPGRATPAWRASTWLRFDQYLARHVLVEAEVVLLVQLTESLGEAHIQLHPRVRRPEVGRGADQGFNVGHKVLGLLE